MTDIFDTPIGEIFVEANESVITRIAFGNRNIIRNPNELCREAKRQIMEYLHGDRSEFNLPISIKGTDFQRKVWEYVATIPFGLVKSYKEIAEEIGKPKAYRAVGNAVGKNPIVILIPCHRVVSRNALGGFSAPIKIKKYLLKLEKADTFFYGV